MAHHQMELEREIDGLRRYARLLSKNWNDADDLVQECLLRALEKWPRIAGVEDLRRYLFSMLHNLFIDGVPKTGRRGKVVPIETAMMAPALVQGENQDHRLELQDLSDGLDSLPDAQREVVLLVGMAGFTYEEAAKITNCPVGTVMSRLSRGRKALRDYVAGDTVDPAPMQQLAR